jgi:endoglucanase
MIFEKKLLQTLFFCFLFLQVWAGPSVTTKFITLDQFGYLPNAQKVAVIRDPQFGFDGAESFTPSTSYQLREWFSDSVVFTANIVAWNGGLVDSTSGDKTWRFDFSTITRKGDYYVFDPQNNVGSYRFRMPTMFIMRS